MDWEPISEEAIWGEMNAAEAKMSPRQKNLWENIRIVPEKWQQHLGGNEGQGFWVVAIWGRTVLWYNDIEEGFNLSSYQRYGTIEEYYCAQDELQWSLYKILNAVDTGSNFGPSLGPPTALDFRST
ncbi:hypothetical protein ACFSM5_00395 [Lacibacterium aquatile]|uniref:SMI1/KNR4 family protein n=1 Tax=Lacibacterium aquatile TaxID=1168082 RepID=A0ABW5DLG4_9PROT